MTIRFAAYFAAVCVASAPVHADDWSGFYVGAYAGVERLNVVEDGRPIDAVTGLVGNSTGTFDYLGRGAVAGAFVGQTFRNGRNVFGWELGVGTGTNAEFDVGDAPGQLYQFDAELRAELSARYGRLISETDLLYLSVGASRMEGSMDWNFALTQEIIDQSFTGVSVGVGYEKQLRRGRIRAEFEYTQYNAGDAFQSDLFQGVSYEDEPRSVQFQVGYVLPLN